MESVFNLAGLTPGTRSREL